MIDFALDKQLEADCRVLGEAQNALVLLHGNALVPWFIIVPKVAVFDLHELDPATQVGLLGLMNGISRFVKKEFAVSKMNVGAIGNVVRQMHIHIIGRSESDFCWPAVVWGQSRQEPYREEEVLRIAGALADALGAGFRRTYGVTQ